MTAGEIIDIEELIDSAAAGSEVVAFVSSKSSKERQATFRQEQRAKGLQAVTVWVPSTEAASFQVLARSLCDNRNLELRRDCCRDSTTGQFVKVL